MLPLSVCILACNEQKYIGDAILSIRPYVQEIIVLDTGSVDDTVGVARELGATVYSYNWADDFSLARNQLISHATQSTILMLDADERYQGTSEDIIDYILNGKDRVGRIKIMNDQDSEIVETYIARIFPNNGDFIYSGSIHEQLICLSGGLNYYQTTLTVRHIGYQQSVLQEKDKISRNLTLLKKQLNNSPEDPYIHFQIGRCFYVNKQYEEAIVYFSFVIKTLEGESVKPIYESSVYLQLGYSLLQLRKWNEFDDFFDLAIQKNPEYTDLYFMYGVSIIEGKRISLFSKIPDIFSYCLKLGDPNSQKYETVRGVGSFRAMYNLGLFFEITGQMAQAESYYAQSAQYGFVLAKQRLKQLR